MMVDLNLLATWWCSSAFAEQKQKKGQHLNTVKQGIELQFAPV